MKRYRAVSTLSLLTIMSGAAIAEPDLIVSEITSATTFGFVDGKMAYSFGTTLCNVGDSELAWIDGTNQHPLVSQTLYRLADGQLQQIGIGFAHYSTPPLSGNACGLGCTPAGFNALGAGCSSTSSSVIHGDQGNLAPRTEIDPFSGFFPYPFTSIGQIGDAIYKRLQVNLGDVSDLGALYFVETQVITSAENTPETRANNVSYRQVVFSPAAATATVVGPTYTQQPAIFAWRDHGMGIGMPDSSVLISEATIPDDGIIHVGSKATDIGDDTWRYDYAIHNQNSSFGLGWIEYSTGFMGDAHAFTFDDVEYHDDLDGLINDSDWIVKPDACNTFVYSYADGFTHDPLSNETRWGTTYGFSFVTASEPWESTIDGITVGFGTVNSIPEGPYSIDVDAIHPERGGPCNACPPDINGDGALNFFDITAFLTALGAMDSVADFNDDGEFNFFDVSAFLGAYSMGCQ